MNMSKKTTTIFRILTVLYLAALSFLCFHSFKSLPEVPHTIFGLQVDKIVHFCMFLPFPVLVYMSLGRAFKTPWRSVWGIFLIFIIGCAVAGATELLQGLTPDRTPDPLDFKADSIALVLSSFLVFIYNLKKQSDGK